MGLRLPLRSAFEVEEGGWVWLVLPLGLAKIHHVLYEYFRDKTSLDSGVWVSG